MTERHGKHHLSAWVDAETLRRLDAIAARRGWSRRQVLEESIRVYDRLQTLGAAIVADLVESEPVG